MRKSSTNVTIARNMMFDDGNEWLLKSIQSIKGVFPLNSLNMAILATLASISLAIEWIPYIG